jgi:uncharacterized protein YjiS (DUF1127 family)
MKSQGSVQLCISQVNGRRSLAGLVRAAWRQLRRWHSLYRQRQQLAAMSDEMLKDIGLSRADIETEVSRPFWDEPFSR